jgi:hypothetical protein
MATSMWLSRPSVSFAAVEVLARHRAHGLVHGLVVVRGGDDQVAHRDQVVVADAVVVDQRAARRLDDADAFARARAAWPSGRRAEHVRVVQQLAITSIACSTSIMRAQW